MSSQKMKKSILFLIQFLFCTSLFAENKVNSDMQKIADHINKKTKEPWTWVFYGDSITHGAKHTYGWRSFAEIFNERLRFECRLFKDTVINSGTSGEATFELLNPAEYQRRIKRYTPQVVFVLIGMNDMPRKNCRGAEGFRSRLETLVKRLQSDKAIVILQTYNTIDSSFDPRKSPSYVVRLKNISAFNQVIRDTAKKYSTILVDHEKHWQTNAADPATLKLWLGEYIHPGAKGHLEMANTICKVLNIYNPKSFSANVKAQNPF